MAVNTSAIEHSEGEAAHKSENHNEDYTGYGAISEIHHYESFD